MKEFKFNCPACGQHILAQEQWSSRRISCPSCKTEIEIPSPGKGLTTKVRGASGRPATRLNVATESDANKPTPVTARATSDTPQTRPLKEKSNGERIVRDAISDRVDTAATPERPDRVRVAVLTPGVKLDMVRAVRRRIAVEDNWLAGIQQGKLAYAAKREGQNLTLVDVKSTDATRFSLMGAFLIESHLRHVSRTATGRRRLLDQEIPEAIQDALLENMSDEEREEQLESTKKMDPRSLMSISHAQCLAALDILEERYSRRMSQVQAEKANRKLGNVRLTDLVRKLEKKASIAPEDVATALYYELIEVRRRLERLENKPPDAKKTGNPH